MAAGSRRHSLPLVLSSEEQTIAEVHQRGEKQDPPGEDCNYLIPVSGLHYKKSYLRGEKRG